MSEGDNKTLIFRTGREFLEEFRALDAQFDSAVARQQALLRARDAKGASRAARDQSRLGARIQDLILDEIERHWGPQVLEHDSSTPSFPDCWRLQFFGRILRIEYRERSAYKGE
jgi:hypothetical protein